MNKKSLIILLPLILLGCSTPSADIIHPENSPSGPTSTPSTVMTTALSSAVPVQDKTVKPYSMSSIDFNNNFGFALNTPSTYNFSGLINDQGNGIVILKGYAIKIINFKPFGEQKLIDDSFWESHLDIDENGDGILAWSPSPRIVPASVINSSDKGYHLGYKYKNVKNFDVSDETFTDIPNLIHQDKKDKLSKNLKENESLRIDSNGNGIFLIYSPSNSFMIKIVKNYNIENKEYSMDSSIPGISSQIDKNGNGFIYWFSDYQSLTGGSKYQIFIKKIENYSIVGNEINLGSDYTRNSEIILDNKGNGFVTWLVNEQSPHSTKIRKISNYIPEDLSYDLDSNPEINGNNIVLRYNKYVLKNSFGDGLIIWDAINYSGDSNYNANYYARAFENYNVSTQNLRAYKPEAAPTPFPTFVPDSMPQIPAPTSTPYVPVNTQF